MYKAPNPIQDESNPVDAPKSAETVQAEKETLAGAGEKGFSELLALMQGRDLQEPEESYDIEMMAFLNRFEVVDAMTDDGGIMVRFGDNQEYGLGISPDGVSVTGMEHEELFSDQGLEATLESAILARTLPGADTQGVSIPDGLDLKDQLVLKKSAELTGLKICKEDRVDMDSELLSEKFPELDQRLEEAWERVKAKHDMTEPQAEVSATNEIDNELNDPAADSSASGPNQADIAAQPQTIAP